MITNISVRPAARGGKYLGPDAADGNENSAVVFLTNRESTELVGLVLMETSGKDSGPSNLMSPISRAAPYTTDPATVSAKFQVDINEPTTFALHVYGPMSFWDQGRLVTAEITVLPGVDIGTAINPEGLVVEIPGLCISGVTASLNGPTVSCLATMTMMCGCKISSTAGSPWPPSNFVVQLITQMNTPSRYVYPLAFTSANNSTFACPAGTQSQAKPGETVQKAWLVAYEATLGNQGTFQIVPSTTMALPPLVSKMMAVAEARKA